jgi:hypothetical protein
MLAGVMAIPRASGWAERLQKLGRESLVDSTLKQVC